MTRTAPSFYYWARLLERAGLTIDDVELKSVPDDLKVEAIARDLVDVATTIEPKVTRLVSSGDGKVWLPVAAATPDRQNTFLLFGPRLLHQRRDLGRRVMTAYLAGRAQYLEGKTDRNVRILAARTHMDGRRGAADVLAGAIGRPAHRPRRPRGLPEVGAGRRVDRRHRALLDPGRRRVPRADDERLGVAVSH